MSARPRAALWQLSVSTTPAAEEAVAAVLGELLAHPPVCCANLLTGRSRVVLYFEAAALPSPERLREVRARLRALAASVGPVGPVRLTRVRREDWAESWKRHFPPLEIGGALLIRPSWSRRRGRAGQAVVTLDPGLSFGTGQHATTAFCLGQLVACRLVGTRQSCLDVGTGSGILALAAVKLGYAPVKAFDFDPDAVRVARENAVINDVAARVHPRQADVTKLPIVSRERFDLICANLLADLLVQARDVLLVRLAPTGRLVVAGILRTEFASVQKAFAAAGLRLVASRVEKEWRSGAFAR